MINNLQTVKIILTVIIALIYIYRLSTELSLATDNSYTNHAKRKQSDQARVGERKEINKTREIDFISQQEIPNTTHKNATFSEI